MTAKKIVAAILAGEADEDLVSVYRAFKTRIRQVRRVEDLQKTADALKSLSAGAVVEITKISPRYLDGQRCTVVRLQGTRAVIKWADPKLVASLSNGRYGGEFGPTTTIPVTALRRVDKQ